MIDDILQAVKATLQADERLSAIGSYYVADGKVPDANGAISIFCRCIRYREYDAAHDLAIATVSVLACRTDTDPELGEQAIRQLAEDIRHALLANPYLGGLADDSTVIRAAFEHEATSDPATVLYIASLQFRVNFYMARSRPSVTEPPSPSAVELEMGRA